MALNPMKTPAWRKRLRTALTFSLLLLTAARVPAGEQSKQNGLTWLEFEQAMATAKKERRLLVVDFYTDWCGWCKVMERDTYGNAEVIKYARARLVLSKVNAESSALTRYKDQSLTYRQLALAFGVRGYPATIFISPEGEFLTLVSGFIPPDQFLPMLEFLAEGHYKNMKYEDFLHKRKG
ncbi:MAG: thioredoxin fold domain-containing protein [candidate division KSB1 bacterium]|nr:thioredoxin fold domain-containing protein [candidate division KSB1 bacterium]MDZ7274623.1 thioredoxin fold domain-containing protein [candidate division KSB1 bacterium]MDZ7285448.1 thioredoxin fold domain-containing protein [candidate division KSB1 bacterium]MDZ7298480.1 thioredoxin fold domain-containing protein [candidate division KSB1 bacterium]MDZ7306964.1 thioredoxin fold domain-containing protein [candidate division KSB1 bacterium]